MGTSTDLKVVCLQRYPEFFEQTITLLNNQWPRSRTARLRSLDQGSKDSLPTSLVLLQKQDNSGKEIVVAHSKVSPVPYHPQYCFVESVVVDPMMRGKGIGRLIMEHTEHYVKSLGITTVYLTTFDQQGFYSKLGYELCEPVVVFGGGSLKLAEKVDKILSPSHPSPPSQNQIRTQDTETKDVPETIKSTLPPPPPPPPLPNQTGNICNITEVSQKVTMRKFLCEN